MGFHVNLQTATAVTRHGSELHARAGEVPLIVGQVQEPALPVGKRLARSAARCRLCAAATDPAEPFALLRQDRLVPRFGRGGRHGPHHRHLHEGQPRPGEPRSGTERIRQAARAQRLRRRGRSRAGRIAQTRLARLTARARLARVGVGLFRQLPTPCSRSAFHTFCGVIGMSRWRTPRCHIASTMALAIAGGAPTVGDSPTPLAPNG
jgi:hypothetical protein